MTSSYTAFDNQSSPGLLVGLALNPAKLLLLIGKEICFIVYSFMSNVSAFWWLSVIGLQI
jgi:hypothetical protein